MRPPTEAVSPDVPLSLSTEEFARVAKGLAHPARAAIVAALAHRSVLTAGEIVGLSGLAQSTVSQHLRVLRKSGILSTRREGPRVWYRLDPRVLRSMAAELDRLSDDSVPSPTGPTP